MVRLRSIRSNLLGLAALSFAVLLVVACGDGGDYEIDLTVEPSGRIAFASDRDGNADIYIMDADGGQPVNITNSESQDFEPTWSPDGTRLAFSSIADRAGDIYVISASGGDRQQLTDHPAIDSTPRWSPDGSLISFYSARSQGEGFMWLMIPDGTDARVVPLTQDPSDPETPCRAVTPFSWLPDSQRLLFQGSRADTNAVQVCAVNIDGSDVEVIRSDNDAMNIAPAASPDGSRVAFASDRDGEDLEIYVVDTDGGNLRRLTDSSSRDAQPTWSPDGQWIAFTSTRDAGFEVYIMRADGSDLRRLTDNQAIDGDPAWSPR